MKNAFVYNNIPIKKIAFGRLKGEIEIKLTDVHYQVIYHNKVKINDKEQMKRMFSELKSKGFDYMKETSWF